MAREPVGHSLQPQSAEGNIPLQPLLEKFVNDAQLDEGLYQAAFKCAQDCARKNPKASLQDAEDDCGKVADLAGDFLLYLRAERKCHIQTLTGLQQEMNRFAVRRSNPEGRELWHLLSAALKSLAASQAARRLDAAATAANSNQAVWTAAASDCDGLPLDLAAFEERAATIGVITPVPPKSVTRKLESRIISPTQAQSLVRQLLAAAAGPILFEHLFQEARRHVVMMQPLCSLEALEEEHGSSPASSLPDTTSDWSDWIELEAQTRAERIWQQIKTQRLERILHQYYLPKFVMGQKISMSTFGSAQRISEQCRDITQILKRELAAERQSGDRNDRDGRLFRQAWLALTARVLQRLMKINAEKDGIVSFHKRRRETFRILANEKNKNCHQPPAGTGQVIPATAQPAAAHQSASTAGRRSALVNRTNPGK